MEHLLHTSLAVPSFDLHYKRPFLFFYNHSKKDYGYATHYRHLKNHPEPDLDQVTFTSRMQFSAV